MKLKNFICKGLIITLLAIFFVGCTENKEQSGSKQEDNINSKEQSSAENTSPNKNKGEMSYDEIAIEEINSRDDLEIVVDVKVCEDEDVYCFQYYTGAQDIIVKIEMDNKQKEFYDLILTYELPEGGSIEEDGPYYNIIAYENGYKFYKESKMLHHAPYHSTDVVKPTEEQYFGIVIMWVELFGRGGTETIVNEEHAQSRLKGLNKLKEFAQDGVVLTWINNCSTILQQIIDEENPDSAMYLEAWKQLNYLGNVIQVYRYENGYL